MKKDIVFPVLFFAGVLFSGCEFKASDDAAGKIVQLSWNIPATRENGESLYPYEIGGYEIKYRNVSDSEYRSLIVEMTDSDELLKGTSVELSDSGTYEFSVAVFDVNGLYSLYTDAVQVTVD